MSYRNNVWIWVAGALMCTTILGGYFALDYQAKYVRLQDDYEDLENALNAVQENMDELTILVSIKIDYGGGNIEWYNLTRVPLNSNLLEVTDLIVSVDYSEGEFGAFVNSIEDVGGDPNTFWVWNYYSDNEWKFGPVAADSWKMHEGDIVSWAYSKF
jgi:hypothetical protein